MVRQYSPIVQEIREQKKTTIDYFTHALLCSSRFIPMDFSKIAQEVVGPIIYMTSVGLCSALTMGMLNSTLREGEFGFRFLIYNTLIYSFLFPVIFLIYFLTIGLIEAKCIGVDYNKKQLGLHASVLTYMVVVNAIAATGAQLLMIISSMAFLLLNNLYISMTYSNNVEYNTPRESRIHSIIIFLYLLPISYIGIGLFSLSAGLSLNLLNK